MQNNLLEFIKKYHKLKKERGYKKSKDLFPTFDIMKRNLNLTDEQLREELRKLENMGEIERRVSKYYLKDSKKEPTFPKIGKLKIDIDKIKIWILKIGMGIIGIIATIMSIYFTYLWFRSRLNIVFSFALSFSMVGFSVISFESIILFKQNKQYFLIGIFSILWVIVVSFSMASTMAGQLQLEFNRIVKEDTSNLEDSNNISLYQEYTYQIKDYESDLKAKREETNTLRRFLTTIDYDVTADRKRYDDLNYRIILKDKEIKALKSKIEAVQNKKEALLKNDVKINIKKKVDFFEWLESLFKIKADIFKFILYLFPALFIDLIAPISLAMVLFYKKKE